MQDFRRGWLGWTRSERVAAAGIASFILFFAPLMAVLGGHSSEPAPSMSDGMPQDGGTRASRHGAVPVAWRVIAAVTLAALLLFAGRDAFALRSPGAAIRHALRAAAVELQHAPGTMPAAAAWRAMPPHFRHWRATVDPARFPAEIAVTLHGLDLISCRDAVAKARRIEGSVVVELEGYRAPDDCRDDNDMTWRFMP
jgi:hypothetical protein